MALLRESARTVGLCLAVLGLGPVGLAHSGHGQQQGCRQGWHHGGVVYDAGTEARFSGTVEVVQNVTGAGHWCCGGGGGTVVTLKTATESIEVHLGPSAFLKEKTLALAAGDSLDVLGSRVPMGGRSVVLAREVKKGEDTFVLRDAAGCPHWRMGGTF